jgi:hypothetical protein
MLNYQRVSWEYHGFMYLKVIFQCKPGKNLKPGVVLLKVTIIEESPGNSQFFVLYYCYLLLGGSKKISTKGIFFFPA